MSTPRWRECSWSVRMRNVVSVRTVWRGFERSWGSRTWAGRILAIGCLIAVVTAGLVHAQTITQSLEWDHATDTLANIQAYTFTLKIDAGPVVQIAPTCVAQAPTAHCKTPITLASGTHVLIVTATNANGTASGTLNYVPGQQPSGPVNIVIVTKITVP